MIFIVKFILQFLNKEENERAKRREQQQQANIGQPQHLTHFTIFAAEQLELAVRCPPKQKAINSERIVQTLSIQTAPPRTHPSCLCVSSTPYMNILDQKFQKILESLVREEPPQEVDLKSLPQSDLLFVSQLMKLLGKGDISKMVQKDTKLSTHQEEELELIKLALQEADPKAAVYKQLVSKLNISTYQREAQAAQETQAKASIPTFKTEGKIEKRDLKEQYDFDAIFPFLSAQDQLDLMGHKYAVSSSHAQGDQSRYFRSTKLSKALDHVYYPKPYVVAEYAGDLYGNKDRRHLISALISEENQKKFPGALATCRKYILDTKDAQMFYSHQDFIELTDKKLYDYSIDYLVSKDITFNISEEHHFKYYRLLQEFLSLGDFKRVMSANQDTVKSLGAPGDCVVLSILSCVAVQKGLEKQQPFCFKNPDLFFVDAAAVKQGKVTIVASNQKLNKVEVYYTNALVADTQLLKQVQPNFVKLFDRQLSEHLEEIEVPVETASNNLVLNVFFDRVSYQWQYQFQVEQAVFQELTEKGIDLIGVVSSQEKSESKLLKHVSYSDFQNTSQLYVGCGGKQVPVAFPQVTLSCAPVVSFEDADSVRVVPNAAFQLKNCHSGIQLQPERVSLSAVFGQGQEVQMQAVPSDGGFVVKIPEKVISNAYLRFKFTCSLFNEDYSHELTTSFDNSQMVKCATYVYQNAVVSQFFTEYKVVPHLPVSVTVNGQETSSFNLQTDQFGKISISTKDLVASSIGYQFEFEGKSFNVQKQLANEHVRQIPQVFAARDSEVALPGFDALYIAGEKQTIKDGKLSTAGMKPGDYVVCSGKSEELFELVVTENKIQQVDPLVVRETDGGFVVPVGATVKAYGVDLKGKTRKTQYFNSKSVQYVTSKIPAPKPVQLSLSYEEQYLTGLHNAFGQVHTIAAKKPGIVLKERKIELIESTVEILEYIKCCEQESQAVLYDQNMLMDTLECCKESMPCAKPMYSKAKKCVSRSSAPKCDYKMERRCDMYDDITCEPEIIQFITEPLNIFQIRKQIQSSEQKNGNIKTVKVEGNSSGFVLIIQFQGQKCVIEQNLNLKEYITVEKVEKKIDENQFKFEIRDLNVKDIDYYVFNNIGDSLETDKWASKSAQEKLELLLNSSCLEFYFFVKLNDTAFFEEHARKLITELHVQPNVFTAWLLDDTAFLQKQVPDFTRLGALEQFLLLKSKAQVPKFLRDRFVAMNRDRKVDYLRKQRIVEQYQNSITNNIRPQAGVSGDQIGHASAAGMEQTFLGRTDLDLQVSPDCLFVQLLDGKVDFPFVQQESPEAKRVLLAFLQTLSLSVVRVPVVQEDKSGEKPQINVAYQFTTMDGQQHTEPVRNKCQVLSVVISSQHNRDISRSRVKLAVSGAEVAQELVYPKAYNIGPGSETRVQPLIIITGDKPVSVVLEIAQEDAVVFKSEQVLNLQQTKKQSDAEALIAKIAGKQFAPESVCRIKTIDDYQLAQIIKTYAASFVDQIVAHQASVGQLNRFLLSIAGETALAKKLVRAVLLEKNEFMLNRIQPANEVHPLIFARVLAKANVPDQLRQLYAKHLGHCLLFKDYENLFYLAVVSEDFQMAKALFPKCRFARRHQQVVNYYNACVSGGAYAYDPQFNTYSVESALKYGKAAGCNAEKTSIQVKNQKLAIQSKHPRFQVVELKNRQDFQLVQAQKPEELEVRGELTVPIEQKKQHLVVRCELEAFALKNEAPKVHVYRLGNGMVRVTESNKPARKFVEVVVNGAVVQCGYTDVLGLFKMFQGNGEVRVCEQE
ncbi:Conserved_hypothetical protein [Hexamita inflata]|uniref:Uncharacterized protein n=1 Tax=Hexamita inflata TaxID=28002 RepID=A0AA86U8L9_9EUKA|nr:Conserved hypothetical protein [Hexamita inflata]